MTRKAARVGLSIGCVAVAALVLAGMVWLTRAARTVSGHVRATLAAPGPPLSGADVPRILGDVPLPPFFVVDIPASNDPQTRLDALMHTGRGLGGGTGRKEWVLVARSGRGYEAAVRWYDARLARRGYRRTSPGAVPFRTRDREEPVTPMAAWERGRDRFALAPVPARPDHLWLIVSTPPGTRPAKPGR